MEKKKGSPLSNQSLKKAVGREKREADFNNA